MHISFNIQTNLIKLDLYFIQFISTLKLLLFQHVFIHCKHLISFNTQIYYFRILYLITLCIFIPFISFTTEIDSITPVLQRRVLMLKEHESSLRITKLSSAGARLTCRPVWPQCSFSLCHKQKASPPPPTAVAEELSLWQALCCFCVYFLHLIFTTTL